MQSAKASSVVPSAIVAGTICRLPTEKKEWREVRINPSAMSTSCLG